MTRPTLEERQATARDEALAEKFGSVILLSVKVLRPSTEYPYERAVWESEIRAPVRGSSEHVDSIVGAWIKTMEAGIELAGSFRDADKAVVA